MSPPPEQRWHKAHEFGHGSIQDGPGELDAEVGKPYLAYQSDGHAIGEGANQCGYNSHKEPNTCYNRFTLS